MNINEKETIIAKILPADAIYNTFEDEDENDPQFSEHMKNWMVKMSAANANNKEDEDNNEWVYSDDDEEEDNDMDSDEDSELDTPSNNSIKLSNNCSFYQYCEQSETQPVRKPHKHRVSKNDQMKILQ